MFGTAGKLRPKRDITGFLFILPTLLVLAVLLLYPVLASIFYSFTSKHLLKPTYGFVGLKNYIKVLKDPSFYSAFWVSIRWTFFSLLGQLLVGFTAALALNRIRRFQGILRTVLIIPWAFPSIVIALSWKWILNGVYGFVPLLLQKIGITESVPQFFSDSSLVFGTLVFINIWFGSPLIMVNVLSALQTVPQDQYEAAQIDGASAWKCFTVITFPHIRNVVGLLVVLRTIWIFNSFDMIFLLTGGGPANMTASLPIYAYNIGWGVKQLGRASAVTVILLVFLLMLCALYFKLLDHWEKENG